MNIVFCYNSNPIAVKHNFLPNYAFSAPGTMKDKLNQALYFSRIAEAVLDIPMHFNLTVKP